MKSRFTQNYPPPTFYAWLGAFFFVIFCLSRIEPIGKGSFVCGILYTLSFLILIKLVKVFPDKQSVKRQFLIIFFMAIGCRLLFLGLPVSHDLNRHMVEGTILGNGFKPYLHASNDPVLKPLANDLRLKINHKEASVRNPPPFVRILFTLATWISANPVFIKVLCVLFDLASILILSKMLESRAHPISWLMLYALNPLVILFVAGGGYMEMLQVFFICLTLYGFYRKKAAWGFLALGCAMMSGYVAFALLPFVVTSKNWKTSYLLTIPAIACLPVWDSECHFFTSLAHHATHMHYNDSLTWILRAVFGANAGWAALVCFLLCLGIIFVTTHDLLRSSFLVLGALLLFMPILHPRHLILVTPFLVFFPSSAWLYLHFAMGVTFLVLCVQFQPGAFSEIHWLSAFEYIPFYTLLIWNLIRPKRLFASTTFPTVHTFSVVIPTLNESRHIAVAVESLRNQPPVSEIIVVDGGSSDDTRDIAGRLGVNVIDARRGRGHQIKVGVDRSQGDIILILHADCGIRDGTLSRIRETLNGNLESVGGSVGMNYHSETWKHRILALLNNGRARLTGISFGDQAQFFRRSALESMGGYPDQMIMEDVELSMRMKKKGITLFIPDGVVVSERRWAKKGFYSNITRVVTLCLNYLVQRRLEIGDASRSDFYTRYYND